MSVLYYPKLNNFLNLLMQKIGLPHVQDNKSLAQGVTYEYSIADFLVDVKSVFDDTFSNDVYKKLGVRRATTDFPTNLIYSKRKLYDERMNMRLTSEERRFGKVSLETPIKNQSPEARVLRGCLELLPGFGPGTSSLPRMCSTS